MALNFAMLLKLRDDAFHYFSAFVDVRVFATSEKNRHLHLVVVLKESNRLLDLEVDIVVTGLRPDANLFQLGLMCLSLFALLFLVVFELSKVHDSTNGRLCLGSDLN